MLFSFCFGPKISRRLRSRVRFCLCSLFNLHTFFARKMESFFRRDVVHPNPQVRLLPYECYLFRIEKINSLVMFPCSVPPGFACCSCKGVFNQMLIFFFGLFRRKHLSRRLRVVYVSWFWTRKTEEGILQPWSRSPQQVCRLSYACYINVLKRKKSYLRASRKTWVFCSSKGV